MAETETEIDTEAEAVEGTPLLRPKSNDVHVTTSSDSWRPLGGGRLEAAPRYSSLSTRCCGYAAKLPLALCGRRKTDEGTFSSSMAVLLTCLGSVVGTGNIWRFPRILGNHAEEGGALSFLLVWFLFLWLWSIPVVLIEYGVGRYTRKTVIESWASLLGPSYRFLGGFPILVSFFIGSYYSVLVGWCGYYFIQMCAFSLPDSHTHSQDIWDTMQGSRWPVLCHAVAIVLAGLSVSRGVSTIEPVNKVIVPLLLAIVVLCFYWSIFLPYAGNGIIHLFSPSWESLKDSKLWIDAASQNAWDTSAGIGMFLTYSTFMKRSQGAVKLGTLTPFFNNIVSLMCGIIVFSTVFSVQTQEDKSVAEIVDTLKLNGEGNTGLTFIWMPVLFSDIHGGGGRFLAIVFFLCLTLAGLSSLIGLLEQSIHSLTDFGVNRIPATLVVSVAAFLVGLASAMDLSILVNQDAVWGYALILCGCFLIFLVIRFGILRFRKQLYNNFGIGDWPLPWIWVFIVLFVAPVIGVGLITWWIVDSIRMDGGWWLFSSESLAMTLSQWSVVLLVLIGLNWWLRPLTPPPPRRRWLHRTLGMLIKFRDDRGSPTTNYIYRQFEQQSLTSEEESVAMATEERKEKPPVSLQYVKKNAVAMETTTPAIVVEDAEL